MNLITDAWIPIIRASGKKEPISPWQIAEQSDPVMELNAPRPDFQGALYQFLIGLLQSCFAPADHDEWLNYWANVPDGATLQAKFINMATAFELNDQKGSSFMQDLNLLEGENKEIASLLIGAPGGKTIRENLDHFIKRDAVVNMCLPCAAMAVFTLQINAPSGGVGHRVGLRGGGPLTTLVLPTEETTLWHKLWLNVIDADSLIASIEKPLPEVFPWMETTRESSRGGVETRPEDTNPLQMYWGMPRRIRFFFSDTLGTCDLCGAQKTNVITKYMTKNYGVNYVGGWIHPLTPYWFDPKKEKPPLSIKGQRGGLGYHHWVGFALANSEHGDRAAKIARVYMEQRAFYIGGQRRARLWCFGYDMDNMKARCWYEDSLPLFQLDSAQRDNVLAWASDLIGAAEEVAESLQGQVKAAWFARPKDVKGDMSTIAHEFWQQSEENFYRLLKQLTDIPGDQRLAPPQIYAEWGKCLQALAYKLFDEWAMEGPAEDIDMKRIIAARQDLTKKLNMSKSMKELFAKAKPAPLKKGGGANATTSLSLP